MMSVFCSIFLRMFNPYGVIIFGLNYVATILYALRAKTLKFQEHL